MDIEDIELNCNLDFEPEIKNKYNHIIIDIFNNNCPDYYNNDNTDVQIIIALYYYSKKNIDKSINILLGAHNKGNLRATCTLGILYNILNDKENSIKFFTHGSDNNHILSSTNLAYEYLCQGQTDLFIYYNKNGLDKNDENALINLAIYYWNVEKKYNNAIDIFKNLFINNNYRAYYECAKLVKNINEKIEYLTQAIKIKPKKTYIDLLIKMTGDYERYILYKNNNINITKFINIDNAITIKYLENDMSKYSRCPICINFSNQKKELFTLKCNHSICNICIMKYCQKKCCICYA
jgi:hypothetical protein